MKKTFTEEKLNKTLIITATLLANVPDWFIGYGTLLGITRNNSCIDNDDDIDIICNKKSMNLIKKIFIDHGFQLNFVNGDVFFQLRHKDYCLIDFYCCKVTGSTFFDAHENKLWKHCYPLQQKKWNGVLLYLPNNKVTKISKIYGKTWNIPRNNKGVQTRKHKRAQHL